MKKHKIYVAFGMDATQAVYASDMEAVKLDINSTAVFCVREFDTEAEAAAYKKGMDDLDGWRDYMVLSEHDPFEKEIINMINIRENAKLV